MATPDPISLAVSNRLTSPRPRRQPAGSYAGGTATGTTVALPLGTLISTVFPSGTDAGTVIGEIGTALNDVSTVVNIARPHNSIRLRPPWQRCCRALTGRAKRLGCGASTIAEQRQYGVDLGKSAFRSTAAASDISNHRGQCRLAALPAQPAAPVHYAEHSSSPSKRQKTRCRRSMRWDCRCSNS